MTNEVNKTNTQESPAGFAPNMQLLNKDRGIPTGFRDLDATFRFEPGTLTLVGARPGMGKSSFMLNVAFRQAIMRYNPFLACLEEGANDLSLRLACGELEIPIWKAKRGELSATDMHKIELWIVKKEDLLQRIHTSMLMPTTTTTALYKELERVKAGPGCNMVWVDNIHLLRTWRKTTSLKEAFSSVPRELHEMARQLDLPIAALCTASRHSMGRQPAPPRVRDIVTSGLSPMDSDSVLLLHRPSYYGEGADDSLLVDVIQNPYGPTGFAELLFDGPGMRLGDKPLEVCEPAL